MRAIVFSKDRPLQLDGLLRSLALHAAEPVETTVIWKATPMRHAAAYLQLVAMYPAVSFLYEVDFESDVRRLLADAPEHVLFLVDDTLFVRAWSPTICASALSADPGAIGFSLRLGRNTTHCYPVDRAQEVPALDLDEERLWGDSRKTIRSRVIGWTWPGADGDFGYPLEVSSSIYRTADVVGALNGFAFMNPNQLEARFAHMAGAYAALGAPRLLSHSVSVAFSNPCNRVQTTFANRAGTNPAAGADALLVAWEAGTRMKVEAYAGHVPTGAHQEVSIVLEARPRPDGRHIRWQGGNEGPP